MVTGAFFPAFQQKALRSHQRPAQSSACVHSRVLPVAGDDGAMGGWVLLWAVEVVDGGVNTLAVEIGVVPGGGDVLRKDEARLSSSVGPGSVVDSSVRGNNLVAASLCTGLPSVVTAPFVVTWTTRISGLVGES